MTVLKVTNLSLKHGQHYVFQNINFELNQNDFLCIVGPNGSGKTTLLKCLLGEIKPNTGKVIFDNHQSQHIGYLPQSQVNNPIFPASVYEIVASGTLNQIGLFAPYPKQKIASILKTLHIDDFAKRQYNTLSGGQRQRVLLARALAASEGLLILDEPSNNLDYSSRQDFYATLKKLNKTTTIIMVTHDLDHKNLLGNKILSLDPKHAFFGDTNEYVRRIHAH